MREPTLVIRSKPGVDDLIDAHVKGEVTFRDLEKKIAEMGYKTTYLYEQVCAAKAREAE